MRKLLTLMLAAIMLLACTTALAEAPAPHWINSNIIGSVTDDTPTNFRDDFHLAVNKQWLATTKMPEGVSRMTAFYQREEEVRNQLLTLITGEEQKSHEGQLVQRLYRDIMDMEKRNARGMEPIMPFIKAIQGIKTLDELTEYTLRLDQISPSLVSAYVGADYLDSKSHSVFVDAFGLTLGDSDEYKSMTSVGERTKQAYVPLIQKLLARVGYSEQDANATLDMLFELENELGQVMLGSSDSKQSDFYQRTYNPFTIDELNELSPTFPIVTMLKHYTDVGVERFIVSDVKWLEKMNELYVPENLERFKAVLICGTLRSAVNYLDAECIELVDESNSILAGMPMNSVLSDDAFAACSSFFPMAIGRMFSENYVAANTKANVEAIIDEVVDIYKGRLAKIEWLGSETRANAIEKLDNLYVRVAYPDDWTKYDLSDIVFPEDASLIDEVLAVSLHYYNEQIKLATQPVDPEYWQFMSPQTVNAFYDPSANSINIPAGILGGVFYYPNGSIEENLGGIGMVIGHEITHGFDTMGSQYDKDGNMVNWWTDDDRAAFTKLTDKVKAYFDSIEALPGKHVDGLLTIGETVADLGGLSCMIEMSKEYDDFDYEKFFTAYARIWPNQMPEAIQDQLLSHDPHAPGYLRTNATVQQFQEFCDAFGVKEGDGMYLAPEYRLSVW